MQFRTIFTRIDTSCLFPKMQFFRRAKRIKHRCQLFLSPPWVFYKNGSSSPCKCGSYARSFSPLRHPQLLADVEFQHLPCTEFCSRFAILHFEIRWTRRDCLITEDGQIECHRHFCIKHKPIHTLPYSLKSLLWVNKFLSTVDSSPQPWGLQYSYWLMLQLVFRRVEL